MPGLVDRNRYDQLLGRAGVRSTKRRLAVLAVLDRAETPLTAGQIWDLAGREVPLDRVTVYRTLDGLYRAGLIERVRSGGRTFGYHLTAGECNARHPHFYCTCCHQLSCLEPETAGLDLAAFERAAPGRVKHLEIRLEGLCDRCLALGRGE